MADSPTKGANGPVRITIQCDGTPVQETMPPVSIVVRYALNTISSARLEFEDGDMPKGEFPGSDGTHFVPGAKVKIAAGYDQNETPLFEGIVVRHGISISEENVSRLVVECRDAAVAMTLGRHCANFVDKADSDILTAIVGDYGLEATVDSTTPQHREVVQYYCSDWDFFMARAEINALVVIVKDGKITATAPAVSEEPVLKVTWGVDLWSFQADADARWQAPSIQSTSWDPKTQELVKSGDVKPVALNAKGDFTGEKLGSALKQKSASLQTTAPQVRDVLKQWATAAQQKAALARLRGRMSFQGSAKVEVGKVVEVAGVGTRFSGKVYVSAARHRLTEGDWSTEVEFGLEPRWYLERPDVAAPPGAGLMPGIAGAQIGVVMKLDGDPEGGNHIQVRVPTMQATTEGVWARVLQPYASEGFGTFFFPEVNDEVVLAFFNDDPCHPVVLGSLYSSKRAPPYAIEAANDKKAIVSRCKHKIEFDEKDKILTVTTPSNNKIVLNDKDKCILLSDQNGNLVKLSDAGIVLDSAHDIQITAKKGIKMDATNAIVVSSKADIEITGLNVTCEAKAGLKAKGTASAELSASGQTTVKGALVQIN